MKYNPQIHNRQSIRYHGYDYSSSGYYFITICTKDQECFFGEIKNGIMGLSHIGEIAMQTWFEIPLHFQNVRLDEFVVMPNHIHGIIEITHNNRRSQIRECAGVGAQNLEPLPENADCSVNKFQKIIPRSLGSIVRGYKIGVTKKYNELIKNTEPYSIWHRNFYDVIINSDEQLGNIRRYIHNNPSMWNHDSKNPDK